VSAADLDEANRAAARLTSGSTGQVAVASADASGFDWVDRATVVAVQSANAQTGTTYTLALSDLGKLITLSNASPITLTVPTNASVAFADGSRIDIVQTGAGQVTVAGASGVTVNSKNSGLKLVTQYSGASLWYQGSDVWLAVGDLVP
jgi:DNA-binding IclR family transcriptional regulator